MERYVYFASSGNSLYSWSCKYFVKWSGSRGNFQYSEDRKAARRFDKREMDEALARMEPVRYWTGEVLPG
jgi:hypothetical protein